MPALQHVAFEKLQNLSETIVNASIPIFNLKDTNTHDIFIRLCRGHHKQHQSYATLQNITKERRKYKIVGDQTLPTNP